MLKKIINLTILLASYSLYATCQNILVEFKAAYFLPTDSCVKDIFCKGGALFGPEITFQLCQCSNWYGFASIDFLSKNGRSVGLCDFTRMNIMPIAIGAKYFVPFCYGDFYIGLGFQPTHLKTINCSPFVEQKTSKWGFGGIAKIGTYFNLPCCGFIDLFLDYSFVKIDCNKCLTRVVPLQANLSGVIFGGGLGYRF